MAGIAEALLGPQNPFAQWTSQNRNMLTALGAGIAGGTDISSGLGRAAQLMPQARVADDAYATAQKAEAERQQQLNQTTEWLRQRFPQFAGLPPAEGFKAALQAMNDQE